MTPLTSTEIEELRIAIAECVGTKQYVGLKKRGLWYRPKAAGYTSCECEAGRYTREEAQQHEYSRGDYSERVIITEFSIPPYTTSLDAIQQAAMERFSQDGFPFEQELLKRTGGRKPNWQLTPLDWCIAFARTARIWKFKV